mgnify:CR=1 FL=1
MWLSRQSRKEEKDGAVAELGTVTVAGIRPGVYLSGERRNLPLMGPGGYLWRPDQSQQVLVLKAGAGGEEPCVLGTELKSDIQLEPGEIMLLGPGGKSSIRLGVNGNISLTGRVSANGVELPALYQPKEETEGT